jgi:hypothetical protein
MALTEKIYIIKKEKTKKKDDYKILSLQKKNKLKEKKIQRKKLERKKE